MSAGTNLISRQVGSLTLLAVRTLFPPSWWRSQDFLVKTPSFSEDMRDTKRSKDHSPPTRTSSSLPEFHLQALRQGTRGFHTQTFPRIHNLKVCSNPPSAGLVFCFFLSSPARTMKQKEHQATRLPHWRRQSGNRNDQVMGRGSQGLCGDGDGHDGVGGQKGWGEKANRPLFFFSETISTILFSSSLPPTSQLFTRWKISILKTSTLDVYLTSSLPTKRSRKGWMLPCPTTQKRKHKWNQQEIGRTPWRFLTWKRRSKRRSKRKGLWERSFSPLPSPSPPMFPISCPSCLSLEALPASLCVLPLAGPPSLPLPFPTQPVLFHLNLVPSFPPPLPPTTSLRPSLPSSLPNFSLTHLLACLSSYLPSSQLRPHRP